jgi:predicted membrane protein
MLRAREADMGSRRIRITPGLVVGLAVMLLGVVLTLDNVGVLQARQFVRFWPVLLIAAGLVRLRYGGQAGSRGGSYALMFIGLTLVLVNLNILRFRSALALFLVYAGAAIVWRTLRGGGGAPDPTPDPSRHLDLLAVLGGIHRSVSAQDFSGGQATAVLGGCEVDLSRASIESGEAVFNTFAFWGGIDVKVPTDWTVEVQGAAVLGGFNDSSRRPDDDRKKLIVTGYALMGGVEVHN